MVSFMQYLLTEGKQITEGANSSPEKNDSHEILTALLCLLPEKTVEDFLKKMTDDATNALPILAQLYQFANSTVGTQLFGAEKDDMNIKSITLNKASPVLLAKAISAALKIIDVSKTSLGNKNTDTVIHDDENEITEEDLGKLSSNKSLKVYLTGNSWNSDIAKFSGIENLNLMNVDSCGMKDFNSSDIVLAGNKKFLGVSLKHKDRITSQDPTIINRSFLDTLNFDKKTKDTVNAAITKSFNSILGSNKFLDEIFGKKGSNDIPSFIRAIVDTKLIDIIGSFNATSRSYLSLKDVLNAVNIKNSNECQTFIKAVKENAELLDKSAEDENSEDMKNLSVYSMSKSETISKEDKAKLSVDSIKAGKKVANIRKSIRDQFKLLMQNISDNDKQILYKNIRDSIRTNLEKSKSTNDKNIWTLALSDKKGIMNDDYETPEAKKTHTRIKDKVRTLINKSLSDTKSPYKQAIQQAFNSGSVASYVALQLFKIIFKADENDGLNIIRLSKGFDFGLCTGIGNLKKGGTGKNAKPKFEISPALYESIEKVTALLSKLRKLGKPTLIASDDNDANSDAVTLTYILKIGNVNVAKVQIRYKGVYTSSPSFTATMTEEFKNMLEDTKSNIRVNNKQITTLK